MTSSFSASHQQFTNGGVCHGYGVLATKDVPEGHIVCTVPKSAVLSVHTSPIADELTAEEIGGGLGMYGLFLYTFSVSPLYSMICFGR